MKAKKYALIIQGSYSDINVGLYIGEQRVFLKKVCSVRASKVLVPLIDEVLNECNTSLTDIEYIGVETGPGAFTSLRVLIATVNGIALAHNIPLVPVDGLLAATETTLEFSPLYAYNQLFMPLLPAYNNEYYYALSNQANTYFIPNKYDKLETIISNVHHVLDRDKFLGQLVIGLQPDKAIEERFDQEFTRGAIHCHFVRFTQTDSDIVARFAMETWESQDENNRFYEVQPSYLKTQTFKKLKDK